MSEQRLDKIEEAIVKLADNLSEFIAVEGSRQERDKHQVELNERVLKHMKHVDSDMLPTVNRSKKHHEAANHSRSRLDPRSVPKVVYTQLPQRCGHNCERHIWNLPPALQAVQCITGQ